MQQVTTSVWTYREGIMEPGIAPRNLTGYSVEALDGSIGKVDEASNVTGRSLVSCGRHRAMDLRQEGAPPGWRDRQDRPRRGVRSTSTGRRTRSRVRPSSRTRSSATRSIGESSARTTVTPPASASSTVTSPTVRKARQRGPFSFP